MENDWEWKCFRCGAQVNYKSIICQDCVGKKDPLPEDLASKLKKLQDTVGEYLAVTKGYANFASKFGFEKADAEMDVSFEAMDDALTESKGEKP